MAVTATKEAERCIGCGHPLKEGRAFRILKGNVRNGTFVPDEEFGDMHEGCFYEAIDSPESVLREVRRLAKKPRSKKA